MSTDSHLRQAHPPTDLVDCRTEAEVRRVLAGGGVAAMTPKLAAEFGADLDDGSEAGDLEEMLAGDGLLVDEDGGFAGGR